MSCKQINWVNCERVFRLFQFAEYFRPAWDWCMLKSGLSTCSATPHTYIHPHTQDLRYALDAMLALNWKKHLQHNHHNHFEPQVQYHPIITVEVQKFSNIITQNVDNIGHSCPYCIHGIAWLSRWSPRVWWRCRSIARTAGTRDEAEMNPRQFPTREAHVPPLCETAQMRSHVEKSDGYPTCNATCNSTFKTNVPHHAIEEPSTRRMRFKLLTLFSRCVCFFKTFQFPSIPQHLTASHSIPVYPCGVSVLDWCIRLKGRL